MVSGRPPWLRSSAELAHRRCHEEQQPKEAASHPEASPVLWRHDRSLGSGRENKSTEADRRLSSFRSDISAEDSAGRKAFAPVGELSWLRIRSSSVWLD